MGLVYLLAAGHGRRAGGPKAWQAREGQTMLERQLDFLKTIFKPKDIAVSIQAAWLDRCLRIEPDVGWTAVDPDGSPMDSLKALLQALPLTQWGYVYHVDMPVWQPELFRLEGDAEAVVPTYQGKRGHPVALSPKASLANAERLDFWLRERQTLTRELPYPCILENWNATP